MEDHLPGARVLIGAGLVTNVEASDEWSYEGDSKNWPLRSVMWEHAVGHSIRPDFKEGFLLPYQQLLADKRLAGEDLSSFVAHAPSDHFEEFSNVSEHVGHDGAIAALLEMARVVDLLPGVISGPWETVAAWLSDRIGDAWTLRGPYPGIGSVLSAAGLERGALIAYRVTESLADPAMDPWPAIAEAITEATNGQGVANDLVGRMARKAWERVTSDPQRFQLLKMLARFELTTAQARRLFDNKQRAAEGWTISDRELLENPYLLYELDRGRLGAISLQIVDRGLFPRTAAARAVLEADPLPDQTTEAVDDRRVRAACTYLLEQAAEKGHTLMDEQGLRRRLAELNLDPECVPNSDLFELATDGFPPALLETPLAGATDRGWQLARLAGASRRISSEVYSRMARGPIEATWDWRAEIDRAIDHSTSPLALDEEAALTEKAVALKILARSRIAALVGPAGSGKTTMLKALCMHPEVQPRGVLLLAPTGKARVQLGDKVGARALTLAQFLRASGRWHYERGYRMKPEEQRERGYATVVVDEASMLTEEMLAALLDALEGVERIILCGDPRQLPPIGAGRPFFDLVHYLRESQEGEEKGGGGIAELTLSLRQRLEPNTGTANPSGASRDDLALASWFSIDQVSPAADESFARVLSGHDDGTVKIISWTDEEDLSTKLVHYLADQLGITPLDANALRKSLGATTVYNDRPSFAFGSGGSGAEKWQILTPVRSRLGGVAELNRTIRRTWRAGDASIAHRSRRLPAPMGTDEILFFDKVMCVVNHRHTAYCVAEKKNCDGEIANGEIGMVVHWAARENRKPSGLKVEFSTQAGLQFTFWESDLNKEGEYADPLELAYAVTVHKAQGSQFTETLVIIPNPCSLLSPELLYAALTRHRQRTAIFIQGDPLALRGLGSLARSETLSRLTCLFRAPEPFETADGKTLDGSHVHRTSNGDMVISKSEVIVADTLKRLNLSYVYEKELVFEGELPRKPDFTIRISGKPTVYWEHLGMLDRFRYRADWEAKKAWYAEHGILPWTEGGGPAGILVWSTEKSGNRGIDVQEIERLAREVFQVGPAD
ncbi:MAG TPA: AAA family ATPase [Thermoanaerobaculia bacterium]|nr:AAA family ATPase [Thermoanaerobaculia bacterium]